jgi:hypothetical protein
MASTSKPEEETGQATGPDATPPPVTEDDRPAPDEGLRPLVWDTAFVRNASLLLGGVFLLVCLPVWIVAGAWLAGADVNVFDDFANVFALQAAVAGVAAVLLAAAVILFELRGRSRTAEETLRLAREGVVPEEAGTRGLGLPLPTNVDKAIEALAKVLGEFGKLRSPLALLAAGITLFIVGAAVACTALDQEATGATASVQTASRL